MPHVTLPELYALLQVLLVDITLAGDNAVVVGMAVAGLPHGQKRLAVLLGIGAATLLVVNYVVVRGLYGHHRLERVMEGDQDVLIDEGRILQGHLKKELITLAELEAAAHRQGFASLAEVQRAVLEPGGTLSFIAKKPAPEETRHREVLEALDRLGQELAQLRARPSASES